MKDRSGGWGIVAGRVVLSRVEMIVAGFDDGLFGRRLGCLTSTTSLRLGIAPFLRVRDRVTAMIAVVRHVVALLCFVYLEDDTFLSCYW